MKDVTEPTGPPVPLTVLVVDDSRLQRRILVSSLARWNYTVFEASSGAEALSICRDHPVDLVISDWMMPGMNGLELCQAFRALPRDGYGYFILLTSKSEKEDVAQGLEQGADDFLSKPVNAGELRARLRAGARILSMERELIQKNTLLGNTLTELQEVQASVDRDLIEARRLQQSLVQDRHQVLQGVEVSLLLRPCGHVGGDLVGLVPSNRREVGLFSIDVSGHGIASALMTARLASYLSGTSPGQNIALEVDDSGRRQLRPPAEVAAALNDIMLREIETDLYFTLALARLDLVTGRVTIAQAGHPHPMVHRAAGKVEFLGDGGLPIGLIPDAVFAETETVLAPGDRLVLWSDGITESTDAKGIQLEDAELCRVLKQNKAVSGLAFFEAVLWDLSKRSGDAEFADDVSAVLIDYRPSENARANSRSPSLASRSAATAKGAQTAV